MPNQLQQSDRAAMCLSQMEFNRCLLDSQQYTDPLTIQHLKDMEEFFQNLYLKLTEDNPSELPPAIFAKEGNDILLGPSS